MKPVNLTKRLKTITDFIEKNASVADIGTDHGYIPAYLAQTGTVHRLFATDISEASLNAARRTAAEYNVVNAITFYSAPGLDCIDPTDVDTIVIAGMGGETIRDILFSAPWTQAQGTRLILQPQSKVYILFRFLYDKMYNIKIIRYVRDRGKRYIIICVEGKNQYG